MRKNTTMRIVSTNLFGLAGLGAAGSLSTPLAAGGQAGRGPATLAVIMTNDPVSNQIRVYDVDNHVLLQTLSTHGKGGVGGNARGVKQFAGEIFAAVNSGSSTVALYRRNGNGLK